MSNLLYGKVESYFALVKWIKIKGKPISIFPSVEKEVILNNNDSPSLTPIVVESRCYCTFEVLAMNSVSYKFLFF